MSANALYGRDCLTLQQFRADEVRQILALAARFKAGRGPARPLAGRVLAMIFEKASTRTRVSFEAGMYQLGGQALFLAQQDLQLGRGEPVRDTARVLARYVDAIMARTFAHQTLVELAEYASVPVINGLSDLFHPCQALADLLTLQERFGQLAGLRLAYVGDGNNVLHSLLVGGSLLGLDVVAATPPGFEPRPEIVAWAREAAGRAGGHVEVVNDPVAAVRDAHAVYTDVWASMGQEADAERRRALFQDYRVTPELCRAARPDHIFLHCLPAHRGEEVAEEVLEGSHSAVFEQAENRLHAQKALLCALLAEDAPWPSA